MGLSGRWARCRSEEPLRAVGEAEFTVLSVGVKFGEWFGPLCLTQELMKSSIIGTVLDGWTGMDLGGTSWICWPVTVYLVVRIVFC